MQSPTFATNNQSVCKTLLNAMQEAAYLVTPDMLIADINASGAAWFNKPGAEIVGQPLQCLFDADRATRQVNLINTVFGTGEPKVQEQHVAVQTGERWFNARFFPLADEAGRITAVLCQCIDITERKKIEQILQQSHQALLEPQHQPLPDIVQYLCDKEAQYRLLTENMRDVLVIQDAELNILYASPSTEEMFGYTPEEMCKLKMPALVTPDSLRHVEATYTAALTEAQSGTDPEIPLLEFEYIRKDGNRFWGEFHPAFVRDRDGTIVGSQGILRDVTARKQTEAELAQREAFLANIFASIKDGISILGMDLTILSTNQTMEAWYNHAIPLVGKKCYQAYHNRTSPCEICPTRKTIETCMPAVEIVPKTGLGGVVHGWVELFTFPLTDEKSGEMVGIIEYVRDITKRKKAEEDRLKLEKKMLHSQKLESLGVLAGGIAHDFNNLLVGVMGNAEMALFDLASDSPVLPYLQDIQTASTRLADLSNQMLAYSGKGKFVVTSLDLTALVREMTQLLKMSISKKLELSYQLDDQLPNVTGDQSQIRQVIMNLITNAAEAYEESSGTISLVTGVLQADRAGLADHVLAEELSEGKYVFLEVLDTGCGMDRKTKERIFDPFFSTKFTGRGLGLATVLGIVRSHAGAIKFHSEPGQGTRVRVLFPVEQAQIKSSQKNHSIETHAFKGTGLVLLADDEETVRITAQRMLERMGFTVISAVNGEQALARVREHADDLVCVLIDLTMPKLDGLLAINEIKQIRSDLPLILCSGYHSQEVERTFTEKGITGFLQKPFRYHKLVEQLQAFLGN